MAELGNGYVDRLWHVCIFIKYGYNHQVLCCPDIPEACHQLYILMNVVFDLILGEHYAELYSKVQVNAGILIIL